MTVRNRTAALDTRTEAQKKADEAIAQAAETGNWQGFERVQLCTEEGARQLLESRRTMAPAVLLAQITKQPFRWKHHVLRIVRCEYSDGKATVEVAPDMPEFAAEIRKRIEQNRFHYLPYYQGSGFISFPEDYSRYQD
jgi:hypothetical protein